MPARSKGVDNNNFIGEFRKSIEKLKYLDDLNKALYMPNGLENRLSEGASQLTIPFV